MSFRSFAAALVAVACTASADAQSLPKGAKAAVDGYEKAAVSAKKELVKDMDRAIDAVRKSKADAAVVDRNLKQLKAQKERFEEKDDLPTSDALLGATVEYLDRLRKARAELNKVFKQETEEAKRTKDDERLGQLVKAKAGFDAQLPGRDQFQSKSEWHGTRYGASVAIDAHLVLGKVEGNAFKARYSQDTDSAGKFVMEVDGVLDGNAIDFSTTKMIDGDKRVLKFSGYVFENRLIVRVSGATPKGTPATGIIDLRKK
jgi:hypothetical protein